MASNTQVDNQMSSSITGEQQQQSIKTTRAKSSKTKVSKKVISSNIVSTAAKATATTTAKTENITTTIMENVSSSNTVTEVFENLTTTNHSLESKNIENQCNIFLESTAKQNGGGELLPSENGVAKTKTVKMKTSTSSSSLANGKKQSKKVKKSNQLEKENISVKSSFSKFDALQKRNLIHDSNAEKKQDCHVCQKEVYKMEEIKAEKNIYHKNCFRCNECEKQLKVDNYQSHEGVLYCKAHFKSLFMPKVVEETAQDKPRKPELIIRENQPLELPPDVVRASDKPDLGLEELQQINIRSKFEAFEKSQVENDDSRTLEHTPSTVGVKRSASILLKLAKFQAKGSVNNRNDDQDIIPYEEESDSDGESSDADDAESDPDLVRAKRSQRERPVGLGNMNDIKSKFETGHIMSKEERREERKQEIQNIRSRLFMGKQARIKEMYQQAVAESEHGITSVGKKSEIEIGDKARCLKEKFEKGEIFKEYDETARVPEEELEVFESAISKRSRSLFQELDASAVKNQPTPRKRLLSSNDQRNRSFDSQNLVNSNSTDTVVKHDEKIDDVQIETSDISSKFKFFETYKPAENEKKTFRITPPREGVVKLPTPESDDEVANKRPTVVDTEPAEKTHTATIMLSKFRELEQTKNNSSANLGPKSLKCFTPPPDDNRRVYIESESDMENMSEEEEEEDDYDEEIGEEEDSDYNGVHFDARSRDHLEDEALIQAQSAARAKQLRAKFEKWEASEIQREIQDGTINLYEDNSEENQIESAKAIRAKFENMKETQSKQPTRPRYKVNRFV